MAHVARGALLALTVSAMTSCDAGIPPVLSVEAEPGAFDLITLSWSAVPGASGYVLEGRKVPDDFELIGNAPPEVTSVEISFKPPTPELSDFEFRVREHGSQLWSNVIRFRHGIRPPTELQVIADASALHVSWVSYSLVATGFVLERRTVQIDGTAGPWTPRSVTSTARRYTDTDRRDWTDGAAYEYRLAATKGAARSGSISTTGPVSPLLAPRFDGAASLETGGIHLGFHSTSRYATEIALFATRTFFGSEEAEVAVVPASATSYDDVASSPGLYRYRAVARRPRPNGAPIMSASAHIDGMSAPPLSWGVATTRQTTSVGAVAARASSGAFATANLNDSSWSAPVFFAPGAGAGGMLRPADGALLFRPGVVMDRLGHPHTVFADASKQGPHEPVDIVHAWHDGTAWQREVIARRVISTGDATQVVRFDLGPDGTLHASWQTQTRSAFPIEVATRIDGAWTISDVTSALPRECGNGGDVGGVPRCVNHFVVGDAHGAAHLVVVTWADTLAHLWSADQGWSAEMIATGRPVHVWVGDFNVFRVLGGGDGPAIVYEAGDSAGGAITTMVRGSTGWTPPQSVAPDPNGTSTGGWDAARSPDGRRIAVATERDGALWIREADRSVYRKGWFSAGGDFAVGFGPEGKAWVATGFVTYTATGTTPVVVFDER